MDLKEMAYKRKRLELTQIKFMSRIGTGKYSEVKLALNLKDKKHYAVKIFKKIEMIQKNQVKRISWELRILSNLDSPYFPEFLGTCQNYNTFYMFTEYIPGGDLYYWTKQLGAFSLRASVFYTSQMVLMLEHLRNIRVIHRDLKPENFIIGADGYLRLADFGSSLQVEDIFQRTFTTTGTAEFYSPEILLKKGHSIATDYWNLGIIIYELFSIEGPFFHPDPMKMFSKTIKIEFSFPKDFPEQAKAIISGLLKKKPTSRLGMLEGGIADIVNNAFFDGFDWGSLKSRQMTPPFYPDVKNDRDTKNFPSKDYDDKVLRPINNQIDPFIIW